MSSVPETFSAFRIHNDEDGYHAGLEQVSLGDLSEGDVTIECHYSSVNYKDALAGTGKGKIASAFSDHRRYRCRRRGGRQRKRPIQTRRPGAGDRL